LQEKVIVYRISSTSKLRKNARFCAKMQEILLFLLLYLQ